MQISSLFFTGKYDSTEILINRRAPIRSIPKELNGRVNIKTYNQHVYAEIGQGKPIVFSHGIFGGLFNIAKLGFLLKEDYKIIMPYLPMYDTPLLKCTIEELGNYFSSFINDLAFTNYTILASSMGGGAVIGSLHKCNIKAKGIILCGSSGLSAIPLSKGFVKRKKFEFVLEMTRDIFFDRTIPEIEMADDVYNCIQNIDVLLRAIKFTKSTTNTLQHNLISNINTPTLLVWGKQDPITPLKFAYAFNQLIEKSKLIVINNCGHVPTQEQPEIVYEAIMNFFKKINFK